MERESSHSHKTQCENVAHSFIKHPKQNNLEGREKGKWPEEGKGKEKKKTN